MGDAGIAVLVIDTNMAMSKWSKTSLPFLAFCVLDDQYQDALQRMRYPGHVVSRPVNVTAYEEYVASPEALNLANRTISKGLIGMLAVLIVCFALLVVLVI